MTSHQAQNTGKQKWTESSGSSVVIDLPLDLQCELDAHRAANDAVIAHRKQRGDTQSHQGNIWNVCSHANDSVRL